MFLWSWALVAVVAVVLVMLGGGLWWALADFILDRLGAPASEWRARRGEDAKDTVDRLAGGAEPAR